MVAFIENDLIGRVTARFSDDGAWLAVVHNSERVDGCRCPTCGKSWPASHVTCPEDGALLATRTGERIHLAETRILSNGPEVRAHEAHAASPAQEPFGFDTSIDVALDRDSDTGPNQFDPFSSDVSTYLAHRPRLDEPGRLPETKSSDPPTSFVRRLESHIELPDGSLIDDLEIEKKLGEGAMGVVYKARHTKLRRQVAVKVISPSMGADPQALGRFEREARALATLRHPNIVDVHSFGELPDGRSYYSMEYLDGVTLFERLQHGRVPIDEALAILDQMAAALEAAHRAGIVHRDLKPENTFLVRIERELRPIVKLLDFGLSKLSVADGVEKTASGAVIGTCLYISPEQARGPDVDGRTDIYALGVVSYELILGQHPFPRALTATAALAAHLAESPPQPKTLWPAIPAALDLLLYAMIAKDANDRPTLAQVRSVIADVRSGTASEDRASRATTAPVERGALHARVWMGALVVLALVIGIAIGARVLGGVATNDKPQSLPAVNAGNEPPPSELKVPVTIDAGTYAIDADVVTARIDAPAAEVPAQDTTKPSARPKIKGAAKQQTPALVDAGTTMEPRLSPDPPAQRDVDGARPPIAPTITPPTVDEPTQRPPPRKPPGRNDTINPFAKKGSR